MIEPGLEIQEIPEELLETGYNTFEDLKEDFKYLCGYSEGEASHAARNVIEEDLR